MKEDYLLVAISNNEDKVFVVKNIAKSEYKKLLNKQDKCEKEQESKELAIDEKLKRHNNNIQHLYNRDFILAKALYDRFVDRGLIDENKEFDQAFYEYILEDKDIDLKLIPIEFNEILDKVGNL